MWRYDLDTIAQAVGGILHGPNVTVSGATTDTRMLQKGRLFFALKGERFDANELLDSAFEQGAGAVVTTRAEAPGPAVQVEDTLVALQRLAAWHRAQFDIPLFALTGSCGKTTTKDYVAALFATRFKVVKTQGNLNNDIGVPLSLLGLLPDTEAAVIEMGANHIGEIAGLCRMARPNASAITMIGAAHVEGFGSIEGVAAAKSEIASGLGRDGVFYVNNDDPRCVRIGEQFSGETVHFGKGGEVSLRSLEGAPGDMVLDIDPIGKLRLPLPAPAYATNVMLACAVALRHGVTEFEAPLREATQNGVRLQTLRLGDIEVIDDTYNASPPSVVAAIDSLTLRPGNRKLAILGDMFELGPDAPLWHADVGAYAGDHGVAEVYTLGEHAAHTADAARDHGASRAEALDTPEAIAAAVLESAQPGDVVLVKGSRGMRMERVIAAMRAQLQQQAPNGAES